MDLYAILVTTHVLAGVVGATLVVVPLMTPKGQAWHRRAGLVVTVAMAITAGTGLAIAIWWLALPIVSPSPPQLAWLLVGLAAMVATATWRGWRAARYRGERGRWDRVVGVIGLAFAGTVAVNAAALSSLWLGAFSALMAAAMLRDQSRFRPADYVDEHLTANMVAVLGALTGFLVLRNAVALVPVLLAVGGAAAWLARRHFRIGG